MVPGNDIICYYITIVGQFVLQQNGVLCFIKSNMLVLVKELCEEVVYLRSIIARGIAEVPGP